LESRVCISTEAVSAFPLLFGDVAVSSAEAGDDETGGGEAGTLEGLKLQVLINEI
jgi:hypothetical protein